MFFANGETVTVTDAPTLDRNGDPTSPEVPRTVDNVGVAPTSTTSDTDHRNTAVTNFEMIFPAGDPIGVGAHVTRADGTRCRVVGRPPSWHHPMTGWDPGVVVTAQEVR